MVFSYIKNNWKIILCLFLLIGLVYANSLGNDFVSDDLDYINNEKLGKISLFVFPSFPFFSLVNFFRFPLTIFGSLPAVYRLINIFFHFGSSVLIYFLIDYFFSSPLGFFTAAVFAVHPFLVESVGWISGIPYVQSSFFLLLSLVLFIKVFRLKKIENKIYVLSFIAYVLALFSNEKVFVFPLILFFYVLFFEKIKTGWKKLLPFFVFSGIWVLFLLGQLDFRINYVLPSVVDKPSTYNPLVQIPVAITSYLELIFWPKNLTLYHSEMHFSQAEYLVRLILFLLFTASIIFTYKKNKKISFWLLFFIISLSPTLTPFKISWIVAERYAYLGSVGIILMIVLLINKTAGLFKNKNITYLLFVLVLVLLSVRTITRNIDWKNQDNLWLSAAKTSPSSPQNHNNLGDLYARKGDNAKAIQEFITAVKILPTYAEAYHNLANTYIKTGQIDLAIENYKLAIYYKPDLLPSHLNLTLTYFKLEKLQDALLSAQKLVEINPQNPEGHLLLAVIYLRLNQPESAKNELLEVLNLDPQNQAAQELLKTNF